MAGTPNVSRTIFDEVKRYWGRRSQQGTEICDWDINEDWDEIVWWLTTQFRELVNGSGAVTSSASAYPFMMSEATAPTNNIEFGEGLYFVKGRPVYTTAAFDYNESGSTPANYILKGELTSVVENTPGTDYDLFDTEQNFVTNHCLDGDTIGNAARIRFTSGALSGSEFDIDQRLGTTSFRVLDDLSTALAGDSYVLLPPALITPAAGLQIDTLHLVTFFDDVSSVQDGDLEDPVLLVEPSQRRELRWMVYNNWPGSDDSDITSGFQSVILGTVSRNAGDTDINTADIINSSMIIKTLNSIYINEVGVSVNNQEISRNENLHSNLDYIPTVEGGVLPQFDRGAATYDEGLLGYISRYIDGNTSSKWLAELAGSAGTFASSGTKAFGLENTGSTTTVAKEFTTGDIESDELVTTAAYVDTSNNIVRTMRMGEHMEHRGFNWRTTGTGEITIYPGERFSWGTRLQLERPLAITTASDFVGSITANSWVYVYLAKKSAALTDYRSLIGFMSHEQPNWDGSYPDPSGLIAALTNTDGRAFCVGIARTGAGAAPPLYESYCLNNTVFFREDNTDYEALKLTSASITGTTETQLYDAPKGASELGLEIVYEDLTWAVNKPYIDVISKYGGGSELWTQRYYLPDDQSDVGNDQQKATRSFVYPCFVGDELYAKLTHVSTITLDVGVRYLRFNPVHMHDAADWSQE